MLLSHSLTGQENQKHVKMKENILIIGGGIAGLEAASQLLKLGYNPIIVEKSDHLGGHVAEWNRLFPDMTPAEDAVARLVSGTTEANIFLNTEIAFVNRLKDSYNIMLTNGISIITRILLFATGFSLFDASKKEEYGYGVYNQVMTTKKEFLAILEQMYERGYVLVRLHDLAHIETDIKAAEKELDLKAAARATALVSEPPRPNVV